MPGPALRPSSVPAKTKILVLLGCSSLLVGLGGGCSRTVYVYGHPGRAPAVGQHGYGELGAARPVSSTAQNVYVDVDASSHAKVDVVGEWPEPSRPADPPAQRPVPTADPSPPRAPPRAPTPPGSPHGPTRIDDPPPGGPPRARLRARPVRPTSPPRPPARVRGPGPKPAAKVRPDRRKSQRPKPPPKPGPARGRSRRPKSVGTPARGPAVRAPARSPDPRVRRTPRGKGSDGGHQKGSPTASR